VYQPHLDSSPAERLAISGARQLLTANLTVERVLTNHMGGVKTVIIGLCLRHF
jgi:hypothetical protein